MSNMWTETQVGHFLIFLVFLLVVAVLLYCIYVVVILYYDLVRNWKWYRDRRNKRLRG